MAIISGKSPSRHRQFLNLSAERQKTGLSLEQIAETTKISIRFLRAIEAEEFSKLPGGIFATSYLRQYAGAIGYDESELLRHYRSEVGLTEEEAAPVKAAEPARGFLQKWFRLTAPLRS